MNEEIKKITDEAIESGYNLGKEKVEYFEKQIKGLILIMQQKANNKDFMVERSYVVEKLNMILSGGIRFHPLILEKLE